MSKLFIVVNQLKKKTEFANYYTRFKKLTTLVKKTVLLNVNKLKFYSFFTRYLLIVFLY